MSSGPLVLCYHAVSARWPSELAVPPAALEHQLAALLDRGYRAVTFSEAVASPHDEWMLAVTFDDAFQSVLTAGLPVLERFGIPATMFVPSAFVGAQSLAWRGIDHWLLGPYAKELEPMSWASLRRLSTLGWEIGSHTRSHPWLTKLPDDELGSELRESRRTLEGGLGIACRTLAYPFGDVDRRVVEAARAAGYRAAAALPLNLGHPQPLKWPRVGIYRTDGRWRFGLKVGRAVRAARRTPAAGALLAAHKLALFASHPAANPTAPSVLVTDAQERSIVAVTRALGRRGYDVGAIASSRPAPAQWSRFCTERLTIPGPLNDEQAYVDELERVLASGLYSLFMPGSDPALLVTSKHRARLERHVTIGFPPHDTVLRTLDKVALAQAAAGSGLDVPDFVRCPTVEDARAAARGFGYPVAVKPRSSVFETAGVLRHLPGRLVASEAELERVAPAYGDQCLVQRREFGTLLAFGGVFVRGRLIASTLSRCWRTHRPDSGNIAFARTIRLPEWLRASAERLAAAIGHEGIFELDLIARPDGSIAVIDLNPRPYGSLALAAASGADLAWIWCEHLLGRTPEPANGRPGHCFRWEEADVFNLVCNLRERRVRDAARVLVPHRRVVHAFFSLQDPGPFAAHAACLADEMLANGLADRRELTLQHSR